MLDLARNETDPLEVAPPGSLRPPPHSIRFPALPSAEAEAFVQEQLTQRWLVFPEVLERVVAFTNRLRAAAQDGGALLFVAVHRENFPTLGYLVHSLRARGVRAFGVYIMARFDESWPEPFEDILSCRGSFGVFSEVVMRAANVPIYLQAHAQRAFLSQLVHALRPDLRVFQEVYDWMDSFIDPKHEQDFVADGVFSAIDIQVMRASERYVRTRTSGFIYKDGGWPMAELLAAATVPSLELMPCPPQSFQHEPLTPPPGPVRLVHAGQLRSAGSSRAFNDIYALPLYENLLAQGCDVTVFPSAATGQALEDFFGDYRRLAAREPRAHFREHLSLRELIYAMHGRFHYGMLLYHFNSDCIVGRRHLSAALASKLFAYWAAGMPVLVSEELEYMASLVRETGAGLVVTRAELESLAPRLQGLDYAALQERVVAAQKRYHIERFLPALIELLTKP